MKYFRAKLFAFIIILVFVLTGCNQNSELAGDVLEGHWMDENGNTITFIGDGSVMWYGSSYSYAIYDTDKVIIRNQDTQIGNYSFNVKSEVLELKDLDLNITKELYGSESKQEKILKDIQEAELAQMEAEMKAEKEFYEAVTAHEWEMELELCYSYKTQCAQKCDQSKSEDDKAFYQDEIDAIQERIDVLETKDFEKIDDHSFQKACDWIYWYILPEDVATDEGLIFEDEGRHYIDNTTDNSAIIGYMVRVRMDNGVTAPTYGTYVVQFSTTNIYEYDMDGEGWKCIFSLNVLEN